MKTKAADSPVEQKLRKFSIAVRGKVSEKLAKLESSDIIERITASDWVAPIVVARKKNGDIRRRVDLCKPNTAVVLDSYPLPCFDELFDKHSGANVSSKLDLSLA